MNTEHVVVADDLTRGALMRAAGYASVMVALVLIALKLWAYWQTSSVAMLSSLADSALDFVASLITFVALRVALMPADKEHRFGHGKSEAVAGVAQAIIITGSAVFVAVRAVARILDPAPIEALSIGLSVMTASLVLTIGLVAFQSFVVRRTGSVAVNADAAHYRADILTNVAVIVALFLSSEFGWLYADPILGLIVVLLILASARTVVQSALRDLMDHELPDKDREAIRRIAMNHADVLGVHEMRTRSSGVEQFVQLHIELDGILTLRRAHDISDEVEAQIKSQFPAADVLIHTDPFDG